MERTRCPKLLLTRAFKTKVWELSVIYSHA
jgi:hypothetical protein